MKERLENCFFQAPLAKPNHESWIRGRRSWTRKLRRQRRREEYQEGWQADRLFVESKHRSRGLHKSGVEEVIDRRCRFLKRIPMSDAERKKWQYNNYGGTDISDTDHIDLALKYCDPIKERIMVRSAYMSAPSMGVLLHHLKRYDQPDFYFLEPALDLIARSRTWLHQSEYHGIRRVWRNIPIPWLSEESESSYPGIYFRLNKFTDKASCEYEAVGEYLAAREDIYNGLKVEPRPCAIFGRGKRVQCTLETGLVAQPRSGRMVLACDTRDHMLMSPFAQRVTEYIYSNWLHTNMMLGMTWQYCGGMVFLFNIICELTNQRDRKKNFHERVKFDEVHDMREVLNNFVKDHEGSYRYFCLDVRRQDATVNTCQMDEFFAFMRATYLVYGSDNRRKFGRWCAWVRDYMINTPIALPDGQVWKKQKGNVSGSPLTTLLNTFTSTQLAYVIGLAVFGEEAVEKGCFRTYGDNIIIIVPRDPAYEDLGLDDLKEASMAIFNQELNPDESYEAKWLVHQSSHEHKDSVSFLSKHVTIDGGVWRPTIDTILSMISPEARTLNDGERWARAIGLYYDNPFNLEATAFLDEIMDRLWLKGFTEPVEIRRMTKRLAHRLPMDDFGTGWFARRPSAFDAQMLYIMTQEIYSVMPYEDPIMAFEKLPPELACPDNIAIDDSWRGT